MTVSGDLATIDLADLLQNIEAHARTGTLTLSSDDGEARLYFRGGKVALMTRPERPRLVDVLVAGGHVSERRLDAARKKQKGSRRPVLDFLVGARVLTVETVRGIAEQRLADDVANLIAAARGEFRFVASETPDGEFDDDEASLALALAVAPLVLEASRRVDDWAEIRKYVPSDAMHFRVRDGGRPPADAEDPEFAAALVAALDGSRSALEVVETFADRRFDAFKLLAALVRDRIARPVDAEDLLALAEDLAAQDPERARRMVRHALEGEPHHLGLLAAEARIAETLHDLASAAAAHKLLAHLHLEAGRANDAAAALAAGKRLTPSDASLWERSLQFELAQGRHQEALRDGLELVELYRGPGLHARARATLERLLPIDPDRLDLHVEFARTCVDCGEPEVGLDHLAHRAKTLISAGDYAQARTLYGEMLAIDPGHREAQLSIELIDQEEFQRRRERRRRLFWTGIAGAVMALFGMLFGCEILARIDYVEIRGLISRERMIEQGHHADALALWERFCREHRLAATSWFDVPQLIDDLRDRIAESGDQPRPGRR